MCIPRRRRSGVEPWFPVTACVQAGRWGDLSGSIGGVGSATDEVEIRAAGAVVRRVGKKDRVEVLLIHRPNHADWSFPKGKLDPGEDEPTAAVREVFEETGVVCLLGAPLADVHYDDRHGRSKRVRYFHATVAAEMEFAPNDEVDELCWVSLKKAGKTLTYDHDRKVAAMLAVGVTVD